MDQNNSNKTFYENEKSDNNSPEIISSIPDSPKIYLPSFDPSKVPDKFNPHITEFSKIIEGYLNIFKFSLGGTSVHKFATDIIDLNYFFKQDELAYMFHIIETIKQIKNTYGFTLSKNNAKFGIFIPSTFIRDKEEYKNSGSMLKIINIHLKSELLKSCKYDECLEIIKKFFLNKFRRTSFKILNNLLIEFFTQEDLDW